MDGDLDGFDLYTRGGWPRVNRNPDQAPLEGITPIGRGTPPMPSGVFLIPLCVTMEQWKRIMSALDLGAQVLYDDFSDEVVMPLLNAREYVDAPFEADCMPNLYRYRINNCQLQESENNGPWVNIGSIDCVGTPELRAVAIDDDCTRFDWKYADEPFTAWRALATICNGSDGTNGTNGRTPELRAIESGNCTEIAWKYADEPFTAWRALATICNGTNGTNGEDGDDGRTPQIRSIADGPECNRIEWKYTDEPFTAWRLIATVCDGQDGQDGVNGRNAIMRSVPVGDRCNAIEWKHADPETPLTTDWDRLLTICDPDRAPLPTNDDLPTSQCQAAHNAAEHLEDIFRDLIRGVITTAGPIGVGLIAAKLAIALGIKTAGIGFVLVIAIAKRLIDFSTETSFDAEFPESLFEGPLKCDFYNTMHEDGQWDDEEFNSLLASLAARGGPYETIRLLLEAFGRTNANWWATFEDDETANCDECNGNNLACNDSATIAIDGRSNAWRSTPFATRTGVRYRIEATGSWRYSIEPNSNVDAFYAQRVDSSGIWDQMPPSTLAVSYRNVPLPSPIPAQGGPYTWFATGNGFAWEFRANDGPYEDNSQGNLTYTITCDPE